MAKAGNSAKSRGSARADINQPKSGSNDFQNITLNVIFLTSPGCSGRSRGQRCLAAMTLTIVSAANSSKRKGGQRLLKQRQCTCRQPKSCSKSSGNAAGGGGDSGSRGSGSGNGDGGNEGDSAAAMVAVIVAPTWRQQWQRGRPMWGEVIFHSTYYYLLTVCTDVITIVRRMEKHKSILIRDLNVF